MRTLETNAKAEAGAASLEWGSETYPPRWWLTFRQIRRDCEKHLCEGYQGPEVQTRDPQVQVQACEGINRDGHFADGHGEVFPERPLRAEQIRLVCDVAEQIGNLARGSR